MGLYKSIVSYSIKFQRLRAFFEIEFREEIIDSLKSSESVHGYLLAHLQAHARGFRRRKRKRPTSMIPDRRNDVTTDVTLVQLQTLRVKDAFAVKVTQNPPFAIFFHQTYNLQWLLNARHWTEPFRQSFWCFPLLVRFLQAFLHKMRLHCADRRQGCRRRGRSGRAGAWRRRGRRGENEHATGRAASYSALKMVRTPSSVSRA